MTQPEHETILRRGTSSDWLYIDSLRKREGKALGFIPKDAYLSVLTNTRVGNRDRWKYADLWVTEDNGDLTGFCYVSFSGVTVNIFQIVVQEDARRWYRALLMIDAVEAEALRCYKQRISARVAVDLESNLFWRAIGFDPIKQVTSTWLNQTESKSKRPLWVYRKELPGLFQTVKTAIQ